MFRKLALSLALSAALTAPASAAEWSSTDTALALTAAAIHVVDWQQTREIADRPTEYRELNPILGSHPTKGQVDAYFAATAIGWALTFYMLPDEWRTAGLSVVVAVTGFGIARNYSIGLRRVF